MNASLRTICLVFFVSVLVLLIFLANASATRADELIVFSTDKFSASISSFSRIVRVGFTSRFIGEVGHDVYPISVNPTRPFFFNHEIDSSTNSKVFIFEFAYDYPITILAIGLCGFVFIFFKRTRPDNAR